MQSLLRTIAFCFVALAASVPANETAKETTDTLRDFGKAVFSEIERRAIRDYYREMAGATDEDASRRDRGPDATDGKNKGKNKGKDKNKQKHLPPGIAKKLERGGTLPPGIAKRDLAPDLERRLPPVRDGYERAEIDGDVVLIEIATRTVADILYRSAAKTGRELFRDSP